MRRVPTRLARLARAGRSFVLTLFAGAAFAACAAEPEIVVRELHPFAFIDARDALEDALAEEGLPPATVSDFGGMLARTAPELGHEPELYRDAVIYSFCSARVAARMAAEDRRRIALCPLTVALYTLPADPRRVHLVYRPPGTDSPAGRLAAELLARIAARTARALGTR